MKNAKKKQHKCMPIFDDQGEVTLCHDCMLNALRLEAMLYPDETLPLVAHEAQCGTFSDLPCDCDPIEVGEDDLPLVPRMN